MGGVSSMFLSINFSIVVALSITFLSGINLCKFFSLRFSSSRKIFFVKFINCFIKIKSLGLLVPAVTLANALSRSGTLAKSFMIISSVLKL